MTEAKTQIRKGIIKDIKAEIKEKVVFKLSAKELYVIVSRLMEEYGSSPC